MGALLHIIASCTDRKTVSPAARLRLRDVRHSELSLRAAAWCERLVGDGDRLAASELYCGEHWSRVLSLLAVARERGHEVVLWVASAGYGLVSASQELLPYSATFSSNSEDSVWRPGNGPRALVLRQWWSLLAATRGMSLGFVEEIARRDPDARILMVASPSYVEAMADDLIAARDRLSRPEALMIVSSSVPAELEPNQVPSTEILLGRVGGSRIALHARVASELLATSDTLAASALRGHVAEWARALRPPKKFERRPMTDEEVRGFIGQAGVESWSAGLRALRGRGLACEQKRFRRLFQEERSR